MLTSGGMNPMTSRLLLALLSPLLLTSCFLTPGKFTSNLSLMKTGNFSYSYKGEIQLLALSKLAEMGKNTPEEFEETPCFDDEFELRDCTKEEIAEQRADWEDSAQQRMASKRQEAEQVKAMLGGIDPSSPEAAAEFVELLKRQRGWKSVVDKGDGLFEVDFAIEGQLSHDFAFPMIERMPVGSSFVTVILRDDGKVRVDATGFAAQGAGNPMQAMMGGMFGMAQLSAQGGEGGQPPVKIAMPDGVFTIRTDGQILANNTDEGASAEGGARVLTWEISPRTDQAPTALIDLSQ